MSCPRPFCDGSTRARLSADGKFYIYLFAAGSHDLRRLRRDGAKDEDLARCIRSIRARRVDRYSDLRYAQTRQRFKIEMSYIGG